MAKCYSHLSVAAKRVTNFPRTSWTSEINTNLQPKPGTLGLGTVPWYWPLQNQNQLCTQKNLGETVSLLAHLWDAREYISLLTPGSLSLLSPQAANPSSHRSSVEGLVSIPDPTLFQSTNTVQLRQAKSLPLENVRAGNHSGLRLTRLCKHSRDFPG